MTLDIAAHLAKVRRAILALGGTVSRFEVLPPAQEADVRRMESQIGRAFPRAMRRFFLEQSAGSTSTGNCQTMRAAYRSRYLDHDGGDRDRLVLHSDAPSFMEAWFRLGCPGPEDEVLGVFLDARSRCISSESRLGREWLSVLDRVAAIGGRGS